MFSPSTVAPIVFINIGWMKRYQGPSATDRLIAKNFGYFKKGKARESDGHEQWNFMDTQGRVYGYVPRSSGIEITKLGAPRSANEVFGVLAVFVARDPLENALKVVGWYENATVSRTASYRVKQGRKVIRASIVTSTDNAHVLPVAQRAVTVPTAGKAAGGIGQSPAWYAEAHPDLVQRVSALVIPWRTSSQPRSQK